MITHTSECQSYIDTRNAAIKAWNEQWPNHCESCLGAGGAGYSYDPSPSGVGLSSGCMYDFDPCPGCVEKGICPRCGFEPAWDLEVDDGSTPCPYCQWNPDKPDSCPPSPECGCWMDEPGLPPDGVSWDEYEIPF